MVYNEYMNAENSFVGMKKEGHYDFSEIKQNNDALIIHGKSVS